MSDKQDSNLTRLAIAEEATLGVLPANSHWLQMEPNDYPDFGNAVTKVARDTLNPTRKKLKGGVTDKDASGGFTHDLVPNWLLRVMRGFFFTDGDERPSTDPLDISDRVDVVAITGGGTDSVTLDGTVMGLTAGTLVSLDGCTNSANNGAFLIDSVASPTIFLDSAELVSETPPADARVRAVGYQFDSGVLTATVGGDSLILACTPPNALNALPVKPGDTVFIGGDLVAERFNTLGAGYARVVSKAGGVMTLKDFTGTPATDAGADKTIRIYYPTVAFRDEPLALDIVRRSYQLERTLGEDSNGPQAEYLIGAVPNEMSISIPMSDKMTVSFGYMAKGYETLNGADELKTAETEATLYPPEVEEFLNSSSDLYVARLLKDVGQTSLVGFLENVDITVSNGVSPNKALAVTGAFDFSAGDFDVTGSVTAYFDTVAAMDAISDNDDVALQIIGARNNEGFAIAMPLVTLGGGQADVTPDEAIKLPLDLMAAAGAEGVTMVYNQFAYLPTVAMPTA